tara:strand:- start:713 stop:1093 length:381 start_codon:yes stop_codon:yes gene_type:complete
MTDNLYYPPSKDELSKALKKRYIWKKNEYIDGWCCTFYENVYHLLRQPKGAYIPGEDPIDINNTNFMNEILKIFSDKDIANRLGNYQVFSNNSLSEEEFNKLVDIMYKLFQDGVAEFISWDRICRQ